MTHVYWSSTEAQVELNELDEDLSRAWSGCAGVELGVPTMMQLCRELRLLRRQMAILAEAIARLSECGGDDRDEIQL